MKAARVHKTEDLRIEDVAEPRCPDGGMVIKVEACAVCGTDVKILHHGHRMIVFPRTTGHEVSGTVTEVSPGVEGYAPGDRVAVAPAVPCGECHMCHGGMQGMCENLTAIGYHYDGGFAEKMAVPAVAVRNGCVNEVPEGVSFEEAALAEPLACCVNAQELIWLGLGHTVVVIGAGPIGCFNAQLARARGATTVMLMDTSDERLAMSAVAEPDHAVNPTKIDAKEFVMDHTGGRGADRVIVACGAPKAQESALELVAKRGVVNFFGGLPKGHSTIQFDSNLTHYREFYVIGNHGSSPRHNALALDLIRAGKIHAREFVTRRFAIDHTLEALATAEKAEGLKVVVSGVEGP
jgi:L-iditol 2-dehydrogenase